MWEEKTFHRLLYEPSHMCMGVCRRAPNGEQCTAVEMIDVHDAHGSAAMKPCKSA